MADKDQIVPFQIQQFTQLEGIMIRNKVNTVSGTCVSTNK
jgi:hypothetical protein